MTDLIEIKEFVVEAKENPGYSLGDKAVRLGGDITIAEKGINESERSVDWMITTNDIDRDQDVINPSGWELDNYLKNPVVLWAHMSRELPIGKALSVEQAPNGLRSSCQFTTRDENPMGDMVFNLIKGGFLRAVSVGFKPKEWTWAEDDSRPYGMNIIRQELYEYSVVPVPANPRALVRAKSAGVDLGPLREWAEKTLDAMGLGGDKIYRGPHVALPVDFKSGGNLSIQFSPLNAATITESPPKSEADSTVPRQEASTSQKSAAFEYRRRALELLRLSH